VSSCPPRATRTGPLRAGHTDEIYYRDLRRILLAASCLEHATEIAPDVRRRVIDTAGHFVPPKNRRMARMLGELGGGPLVLSLLPGPDGLTEEAAGHVQLTATRIGTEAALSVLAAFRGHPSMALRRQLAWSWHRFDTDRYAEEIIAHLDETELYFTAHGPGHLRALRAMGGRARIQVSGMYVLRELLDHIDPERLTHLWLRDGYFIPDGATWLDAFPHLRTLVLPERVRGVLPVFPPWLTVRRVPKGAMV
jgi:hypothetical protein